MPNSTSSCLEFGPLLSRWILHPPRAAAPALASYLLTIVVAYALGILTRFAVADKSGMPGFWTTHWGILFLLSMPLVASVFALYLRALSSALTSLDTLIQPTTAGPTGSTLPFTRYLNGKYAAAHRNWIFLASLALAMVLTAIADGADILAPLRLSWLPRSKELDWSTRGFEVLGALSPVLYFFFNLLAWSMQVFVAFCAMEVLLTTSMVLGTVFRDGIGGKRLLELLAHPARPRDPSACTAKWDDSKQRCGLDDLDWVFLLFVGINILALLMSGVSILSNAYLKLGADLGSDILVFGCLLFLPASALWVFLPYFTGFPKELPADLKGTPCWRSCKSEVF